MEDRQISRSLLANDRPVDTQFGVVNSGDWCELEAARINRSGGQARVEPQGAKVALWRADCPDQIVYEYKR